MSTSRQAASRLLLKEIACRDVIEGEDHVECMDNGIGIPVSEQQRVSERFYRVDKSRSKATGGRVIGLCPNAAAVSRWKCKSGIILRILLFFEASNIIFLRS